MQLKDTAEGFSSILLLHNDDFPEDSWYWLKCVGSEIIC
jgi:hypothetical protein